MDFINQCQSQKIVFLELGVGFNTPTIIRYPFEQMVRQMPQATLIRINLSRSEIPSSISEKGIGIKDDINECLTAILESSK